MLFFSISKNVEEVEHVLSVKPNMVSRRFSMLPGFAPAGEARHFKILIGNKIRELSEGALTIKLPKRGNASPNGMTSLGGSQFNFQPGMSFDFPDEIVCSAFQASTIADVTYADGIDLLETFVDFIV